MRELVQKSWKRKLADREVSPTRSQPGIRVILDFKLICSPPGELGGHMIGVDNQMVPTQGGEVQLRGESHPDRFMFDDQRRIVFLILGKQNSKTCAK